MLIEALPPSASSSAALPEEVLQKMHAGPKADLPTITPEALKEFDGVAMGIPTRYGRAPAQWSAFFDRSEFQYQSFCIVCK